MLHICVTTRAKFDLLLLPTARVVKRTERRHSSAHPIVNASRAVRRETVKKPTPSARTLCLHLPPVLILSPIVLDCACIPPRISLALFLLTFSSSLPPHFTSLYLARYPQLPLISSSNRRGSFFSTAFRIRHVSEARSPHCFWARARVAARGEKLVSYAKPPPRARASSALNLA